MSRPEMKVLCPKCRAMPGEPCRSVKHDGPLNCRIYRFHKKRRQAVYLGALVLGSRKEAVPVRPTGRGRPQVGLVDSAAKGLR